MSAVMYDDGGLRERPGRGPGGNLLSEGTANFSTILLFEEALGQESRIEFCKRIEEAYAERRQVDSERPLVKIDGTRPGDTAQGAASRSRPTARSEGPRRNRPTRSGPRASFSTQ